MKWNYNQLQNNSKYSDNSHKIICLQYYENSESKEQKVKN